MQVSVEDSLVIRYFMTSPVKQFLKYTCDRYACHYYTQRKNNAVPENVYQLLVKAQQITYQTEDSQCRFLQFSTIPIVTKSYHPSNTCAY